MREDGNLWVFDSASGDVKLGKIVLDYRTLKLAEEFPPVQIFPENDQIQPYNPS